MPDTTWGQPDLPELSLIAGRIWRFYESAVVGFRCQRRSEQAPTPLDLVGIPEQVNPRVNL